ncbi:polysaccharide deacetylase family protein [uncultured Christiangramia sp.]|uniref:polysaccharide deacetylase family protein n=1 Tax=uncultured Christiangramia sp. TaxID=503836 RepID=UPI0026263A52|nr:polysaccharide deacetylase family protein [uncultured Christiangramia sp.]
MNGNFVISLDFELIWGVFDKVKLEDKVKYFENTRTIIPKILKLFTENEISCTWATVGMLFNKDWQEWHSNLPTVRPEYTNKILSAYNYVSNLNLNSSKYDHLFFAPDLIEIIRDSEFQEIGTHTYSHYYCLESGQTLNTFEADLSKSIELAGKFGIKMESIVFPRNQFNKNYIEVCHNYGIMNLRSNPDTWYWEDTNESSIQKKILRTADAYTGFQDKSYYLEQDYLNYEQKASRFLRPVSNITWLNRLRLRRIKREMLHAAIYNKTYHLWWHPHNFGASPNQSLLDLKEIIQFFNYCRKTYKMNSCSMRMISHLKTV